MKKAVALIMILISILLISCSSSAEPADTVRLPMRITARLDGSEAVFTADIFEGGCDVTFASQHPLSGTELRLREDGNTATRGDFSREVERGIFPAQEAFARAFTALAKAEGAGVDTENGIKYTIDEMTIMVYYDKSAELITGIETEEGGRRFGFTVVGLELYEGQSESEG